MDPRQRSEEPSCWFDDGTVVLQAEHTLFKVYKGILARESEVFRTMLSLPQPATLSDSEKYGDCQLVVLQDKAEDIVTFIRVINDYNFLAECRSSSVYATLLILSAKYQCTHLRRRVMKPLRSTFQDTSFISSVSNWSSFSTGVKLAEWADITMIANAALDSKTHILLPSILLTGFRQKITTLLEGAPRLEAGGLNALLKATPRLSSRARKVVFAELFDPGTAIPRGCKTEDKCLSTRRVITRDIEVAENVFDPFHMTYRYSSSSSSPLSAEKLCPTCSQTFLPPAIDARMQETWQMLPQIFGLGTWAELRREEERAADCGTE